MTAVKRQKKKFCRSPQLFLALQMQLVVLAKRFRHYSLASFLFAVLLAVPPCPAICKSGGHVPPVPHGVSATRQR